MKGMKTQIRILLTITLAVGIFGQPASVMADERRLDVRVVHVVDGDTLEAETACGGLVFRERIRLLGIDTPERGEKGFERAGDALKGLALNRPAVLVVDISRDGRLERDRFGRVLGRIEVDGRDVGKILLDRGLAEVYRGKR